MQSSSSIDDLTGGSHRRDKGPQSPWSRWGSLAAFLVFTMGIGALIGASNAPGDWYEGIAKPSFNPPNWIFGPVWTLLYALVAIAGWRTWQKGPQGLPMQIWFLQMAVNFTWSPVFFTLHQMGVAGLIIGAMVLLTLVFIQMTWKPDRLTALLMLPYLAWISFAGVLNTTLWWINT